MKAKKLILILLAASPLMLTACPGNDKNVSERVDGTAIKPNAFFQALKQSEDSLQQKHYFNSQVSNGLITYTDLSKINSRGLTTFQEIARYKNISVRAVKNSFYSDIYAFAQNYELLKIRETELKAHNLDLYNEYAAKTFSLGEIFIVERALFSSNLVRTNEDDLSRLGISSINIIDKGVLNIDVVGADYKRVSSAPKALIINAINEAKTNCAALSTMINDKNFGNLVRDLNISDCSSAPASLKVSKLKNIENMRKDDIAKAINKSAVELLENLNGVADAYLSSNSIVLAAERQSGIRDRVRRQWELQIISENPRVRKQILEIALDNNLYENLIFKKNVLESLVMLRPHMTHETRSSIKNSMIALNKGLNGLRYQDINFMVGSSAVNNGVDVVETPAPFVDLSPVQPEAPIDSLTPDEPIVKTPPPAVIAPKPAPPKPEDPGPPAPPTSIRRT